MAPNYSTLTHWTRLLNDAGKIVRDNAIARGWFDLSTLKEPYRAEGKKTMGFELAEQFDWELPDAILYPTGGGTGIVGMWKAFEELESQDCLITRNERRVARASKMRRNRLSHSIPHISHTQASNEKPRSAMRLAAFLSWAAIRRGHS